MNLGLIAYIFPTFLEGKTCSILLFAVISFSALKCLEKALELREEVLDTTDELIYTHQAKAVVLRGLGRKEEAEEEMKRVGELRVGKLL